MKSATRIIIVVGVLVLLMTAVSGLANAAPVYTMPGVPQLVGILDKPYLNYLESDCRSCHGGNFGTADIHHLSATALNTTDPSKGCVACHTVDPVTLAVTTPINRDCLSCHKKTPHHVGQNALAGNCTFCHDPALLQDVGSGFPEPDYVPSLVTPQPHDCANCHIEFNPNWDPSAWDPSDPGYAPDPNANNQPQKDPNELSHHGAMQETLNQECGWCHDTAVPAMVQAPIRMCESCHTIGTLHTIAGHTDTNDKCNGCHGDYMTGTVAPKPDTVDPTLASLSSPYGKKYDYVTLTGLNFNTTTDYGSAYIAYKDALNVERVTLMPAKYWSATEAQVMVPAVGPGNYYIFVQTSFGRSGVKNFSVVVPPTVNSITPAMDKAGSTITISGSGFSLGGAAPQVKFTASGKSYVFTPVSFTDTQVKVTVPATLAVGKYSVSVSTNNGISNYMYFTVAAAPQITSVNPNPATVGKSVTITGKNLALGNIKPTVKLTLGGVVTQATVSSYSSTKVVFTCPAVAKGTYDLLVNNSFADSNAFKLSVK